MTRSLLALAFLGLFVDAHEAQWETAQGGNGRRDGFVDTSGPARMRRSWFIDLRTQDPLQPIVGDGKVFFAHSPDFMSSDGATVSAADLHTGEVLWTATVPLGEGLHPTPQAYRDGVVYVMPTSWFLANEFLYALDADTGALLWQSEDAIMAHFYTSPLFLPNGDLLTNGRLTGSGCRLMRLDHRDGSVVWNRPAGDGSNPEVAGGALYQDRFYIVRDFAGRHQVARINVDTGARMYSSALLGPAGTTAAMENLAIGPDGLILWPFGNQLTGGAQLIAYRDTGTALVEAWRTPIGDSWASNVGVGPDGSIYCRSTTDEVLRLDPLTGAVRSRSRPFLFDVFVTRFAIDRDGRVFGVFQGQGPVPARLQVFEADLQPLWGVRLGSSPNSGPTLAPDGTLIVSTASHVVRTFRPSEIAEAPCLEAAGVHVRNGSGVNPLCFAASDTPRLGRRWHVTVDNSVHPAPSVFGMLFHLRATSGTFLSEGELLVDLTSPRFAFLARPVHSSLESLSIALPARSDLCGRTMHGQAFVFGPGGALLCNALELTLGE